MVVTLSERRPRASAARRESKGQNSAYGLLRSFPMMKRFIPVALAALTLSLGYVAAQQLPPGQIRPRPAEGREPEFPPPNIREYKPRSTLVVPQHPVPRAKFPVIDFHGHPPRLTGPDQVNIVGDSMSPLNLQVMVNANATPSDRLQEEYAAINASRYKGRMVSSSGSISATSARVRARRSRRSSKPTSRPAPWASAKS